MTPLSNRTGRVDILSKYVRSHPTKGGGGITFLKDPSFQSLLMGRTIEYPLSKGGGWSWPFSRLYSAPPGRYPISRNGFLNRLHNSTLSRHYWAIRSIWSWNSNPADASLALLSSEPGEGAKVGVEVVAFRGSEASPIHLPPINLFTVMGKSFRLKFCWWNDTRPRKGFNNAFEWNLPRWKWLTWLWQNIKRLLVRAQNHKLNWTELKVRGYIKTSSSVMNISTDEYIYWVYLNIW